MSADRTVVVPSVGLRIGERRHTLADRQQKVDGGSLVIADTDTRLDDDRMALRRTAANQSFTPWKR